MDSNLSSQSQTSALLSDEREGDKERELVIRGYFHVLFDYFNSRTDPFCLALQLQALGLQWLASRSTDDSLSSFSLHVIGFIMFQMLILCLILLSLTVHAFSHNTDGRGNTKGRGNLGGVELKISSGEQREKKTASFFFVVFPPAVYLRTFQLKTRFSISPLASVLFSLFFGSIGEGEVTHSKPLPNFRGRFEL